MPGRPVIRLMKGLPQDLYSAQGLMYQDWHALTPCQRACNTRFGLEIQREQEDYMAKHPEVTIDKKMNRLTPLFILKYVF